jgi:hypothetical protein
MGINEELDKISRQLKELISAPEASQPNLEPVKILVAVHGIGNQFEFATVRSVADRFCQYMGLPAAIPLGRFRGPDGTITGAYIPSGSMKFFPVGLGFAEIYWADIPRGLVTSGYTLEESKRWARTIVERLQLSETGLRRLTPKQVQDNRLMVQILEEMIQGVAVLGRLLFVAEKAGLFSFNLDKVLNDFLNDVQVVAEFSSERARMLAVFHKVMKAIEEQFPNAEIYLIAHSEGTVVSYLGLLEGLQDPKTPASTEDVPQGLTNPAAGPGPRDPGAAVTSEAGPPGTAIPAAGSGHRDPKAPRWTRMLRGYMTIGSPLNKHVLFWPELFDVYTPPADGPPRRIPWRNYYDKGDPIGFDLRTTRNWMKKSGWGRFFEFNGFEDITATQRAGEARQKAEEVRRRAEAIVAVAPAAAQALSLAAEAEQMAGAATALPDPDEKAAEALEKARQAETKAQVAEKQAAKAHPPRAQAQAARTPQAGRAAPSPLPLHDIGFTRYYFPGAAHNDYWSDEHVFGHFIQDVVDPDRDHPALKQPEPRVSYKTPPRSRLVAVLTSYILPYVFAALLLLLGVYSLYKAVRACIAPTEAGFETALEVVKNVLGLASLIGGMTVLARILRLSRARFWQGVAIVTFVASAFCFHGLVGEQNRMKVGSFLLIHWWPALVIVLSGMVVALVLLAMALRSAAPRTDLRPIGLAGVAGAAVLVALWAISWKYSRQIEWPEDSSTYQFVRATKESDPSLLRVIPRIATLVLVTPACAIGVIASYLSRRYPSLGMKPLIYIGGMLIFAVVVSSIASPQSSSNVARYIENERVDRRLANQVNGCFDKYEKAKKQENDSKKQPRDVKAAEEARRQFERAVARVAELDRQAEVYREGPVWPVVLAGLLFLYLWWLAALLFDLTFAWHRYIRHAVGLDRLKEMIEGDA